MRFDSDTVTVSGQISSASNALGRVRTIEFHANSGNAASARVGISTVSPSRGRELPPGEAVTFNFDGTAPGSVAFSTFYVSLSGADTVDWSVILV